MGLFTPSDLGHSRWNYPLPTRPLNPLSRNQPSTKESWTGTSLHSNPGSPFNPTPLTCTRSTSLNDYAKKGIQFDLAAAPQHLPARQCHASALPRRVQPIDENDLQLKSTDHVPLRSRCSMKSPGPCGCSPCPLPVVTAAAATATASHWQALALALAHSQTQSQSQSKSQPRILDPCLCLPVPASCAILNVLGPAEAVP